MTQQLTDIQKHLYKNAKLWLPGDLPTPETVPCDCGVTWECCSTLNSFACDSNPGIILFVRNSLSIIGITSSSQPSAPQMGTGVSEWESLDRSYNAGPMRFGNFIYSIELYRRRCWFPHEFVSRNLLFFVKTTSLVISHACFKFCET